MDNQVKRLYNKLRRAGFSVVTEWADGVDDALVMFAPSLGYYASINLSLAFPVEVWQGGRSASYGYGEFMRTNHGAGMIPAFDGNGRRIWPPEKLPQAGVAYTRAQNKQVFPLGGLA